MICLDRFCRRCDTQLDDANARRYRGRFIGACRACESWIKSERRNPDFIPYTDSRRKYPIKEIER